MRKSMPAAAKRVNHGPYLFIEAVVSVVDGKISSSEPYFLLGGGTRRAPQLLVFSCHRGLWGNFQKRALHRVIYVRRLLLLPRVALGNKGGIQKLARNLYLELKPNPKQ
jgi:hypothetical protein